MRYWFRNMWLDLSSLYTLEDLAESNYDAIVLFGQYEFEFYNITDFVKILAIARDKNIKIYAVVGSDHEYTDDSLPPHLSEQHKFSDCVQVVPYPEFFFKQALIRFFPTSADFIDPRINNLDDLYYRHHYVYLNGKDRNSRCLMIDQIVKNDLLKYSAYSWHTVNSSYKFEYFDGNKRILDDNFSVCTQHSQIPREYYESFFQLVPETNDAIKFTTEKTVLPLLIGKPFLVAGAAGTHELLKNLGFELYDELFDYSFDTITDSKQRYQAICDNIKNITRLSFNECRQFHEKIQDKINHNRKIAIRLAYNEDIVPALIKDIVKNEKDSQKLNSILLDFEVDNSVLSSIKERFDLAQYLK